MVEKFKYVEGRARSLALSAKIITWFSVGYLVSINQKLPYLLTALSGLIAFLISLKMKEPKILNNLEVEQNFFNQKDYLKNIKNVFIKPIFLILIINGFLLSIVSHIVQINFFQPILIDKNIDISKSGMIMALMTFFEMLGSILLKPINQVLNFYAQNDRLRLIIYSYLFSIGLIIVAFGNYSLMLFGFCLFGFGLGCAHPTHSQLINDVITVKNVRASVLSIQSIFHRLIISMVVANLSFITKNHLTEKFLVLLSIFCMILTPILIYFISKQKSNLSEQNFEN
jgi:cyanate permease